MCQMNVVEGIKTQIFLFNGFLPTVVSFMRSCARYCRAGQAADVNIVRHMRFACWIIKATHTHTKFPCNFPTDVRHWYTYCKSLCWRCSNHRCRLVFQSFELYQAVPFTLILFPLQKRSSHPQDTCFAGDTYAPSVVDVLCWTLVGSFLEHALIRWHLVTQSDGKSRLQRVGRHQGTVAQWNAVCWISYHSLGCWIRPQCRVEWRAGHPWRQRWCPIAGMSVWSLDVGNDWGGWAPAVVAGWSAN